MSSAAARQAPVRATLFWVASHPDDPPSRGGVARQRLIFAAKAGAPRFVTACNARWCRRSLLEMLPASNAWQPGFPFHSASTIRSSLESRSARLKFYFRHVGAGARERTKDRVEQLNLASQALASRSVSSPSFNPIHRRPLVRVAQPAQRRIHTVPTRHIRPGFHLSLDGQRRDGWGG